MVKTWMNAKLKQSAMRIKPLSKSSRITLVAIEFACQDDCLGQSFHNFVRHLDWVDICIIKIIFTAHHLIELIHMLKAKFKRSPITLRSANQTIPAHRPR